MMADILNIPMLGRLEIVETFEYYDQPVLFSCKNAAGRLYLVVAADENERNEHGCTLESLRNASNSSDLD